MAVREIKHTCKPHPFQDAKHGQNKRVFTTTRKQEGTVGRCTVCGGEQNISK